jgi:hypothetical protein
MILRSLQMRNEIILANNKIISMNLSITRVKCYIYKIKIYQFQESTRIEGEFHINLDDILAKGVQVRLDVF